MSLCAANWGLDEIASGRRLSVDTVMPALSANMDGGAFLGNGSTTGLTHALPVARSVTQPFSVIGVGVSNTASGSQTFLNAGTTSFSSILRLDGTTLSFYVAQVNGGSFSSAQIASAASAGMLVVGVGTYDGNSIKLYTRNKPVASGSIAALTASMTSINYLEGNRGSKEAWNGPVNLAGMIDGCLTPQEALSLVENPWQIFRPIPARTWVAFSSTNTDVFPTKGAVVLSGKISSITQPNAIAPVKGSITFTGYVPTISQANSVVPAKGTVTFSGKIPSISQNIGVTGVVGHLTFSGKVPTISQTTVTSVVASTGHFAFTGKQPSIGQTFNQSISASKGTMVFTGKTPIISNGSGSGIYPSPGAVLLGVSYGPTGVEYTGTFSVWDDPRALTVGKFIALKD